MAYTCEYCHHHNYSIGFSHALTKSPTDFSFSKQCTISLLLAGDDYNGTSLPATFNTGDTSVTVMIPVVNDTVVDEGDEEFTIALSIIPAAGVRVELGDVSTTRGVIEDTSKIMFISV